MIVSLPISTGPAFVFLAMDHPPEFLAATALSSLVANAATPIFMSLYAHVAQHRGVIASLAVALTVWVDLVAASTLVVWTLPMTLFLNVALFIVGGLALAGLRQGPRTTAADNRWWDVPLRAFAAMSLCGSLIAASHFFGPKGAGLIALAQIGFVSMALVVHPRAGGRTSAAVFANALFGMVGFGGGLLVVHLTAVQLGSWLSLLGGLATSIAWNGLLVLLRAMQARQGRATQP